MDQIYIEIVKEFVNDIVEIFFNFSKIALPGTTFLTFLNFFIPIYQNRFSLVFDYKVQDMFKVVDGHVVRSIKTVNGRDVDEAKILLHLNFIISNKSKMPVSISFIELEDQESGKYRSYMTERYLTTSNSGYDFGNNGIINVPLHHYTTKFPLKIEGRSSDYLKFVLEIPIGIEFAKCTIYTSSKSVVSPDLLSLVNKELESDAFLVKTSLVGIN